MCRSMICASADTCGKEKKFKKSSIRRQKMIYISVKVVNF